jgi:hypothetical protein
MRSLLLDTQLTPNNRPTPSTTVIRMHIQPRNHFLRSQHHCQLQFCVPLVLLEGDGYRTVVDGLGRNGDPSDNNMVVVNLAELGFHRLSTTHAGQQPCSA